MRCLVVFLFIASMVAPGSVHAKDPGQIFGDLLGGVLDLAQKDQQKKQFKKDWRRCFKQNSLPHCNRAFQYPGLNENGRWELVRQIKVLSKADDNDRPERSYVRPREANTEQINRLKREHSLEAARLNRHIQQLRNELAIATRRAEGNARALQDHRDELKEQLLEQHALSRNLAQASWLKYRNIMMLMASFSIFFIGLLIYQKKKFAGMPQTNSHFEPSLPAASIPKAIAATSSTPPPMPLTGNTPNDVRKALYG